MNDRKRFDALDRAPRPTLVEELRELAAELRRLAENRRGLGELWTGLVAAAELQERAAHRIEALDRVVAEMGGDWSRGRRLGLLYGAALLEQEAAKVGSETDPRREFWEGWARHLSQLLFDGEGDPVDGWEDVADRWGLGLRWDQVVDESEGGE